MLGDQVNCIKKKKIGKRKKIERREKRKEKRIYPDFINKPILLHLWSDRVEIWRKGLKLK